MTLAGKGSKCRVCTHPERVQIESLLARGAGIVSIQPIMESAFSRRALYRHRAKHMIAADALAARPVVFPHAGSTLQKLKWLQREMEHTAALAEHNGDLSTKIKALYALGRMLWLEARLNSGAIDVTPDASDSQADKQWGQRFEDAKARREAALAMRDREEEFLKRFQNTPYRTNRDTPE